MDNRDQQHVWVLIGLENCCKMENALKLYEDEPQFPPRARQDYLQHTFLYLKAFNALGSYYSRVAVPRRRLFDLTIKGHVTAHSALQAQHLNPTWGSCYAGEDFMKLIKQVVLSSSKGVKAENVMKKVAGKYTTGMHCELKDDDGHAYG